MNRRSALASTGALILGGIRRAGLQTAAAKKTYVLVHGGWSGGWAWRSISDLLTSRGHVVFRPTLTGLGERVHLASPDIGLETHITDIVNMILYETLRDVALVGHSCGGMVVTGVADRVPDRISHVVYVDAFVPNDGESMMSLLKLRDGRMAGEIRGDFVMPTWVKPGEAPPAGVPQSLKTFTDSIALENDLRERIPTSYILTVERGTDTDAFDMFAARAKAKGWKLERFTADHNPQWSAPDELSRVLERLVGAAS